MLGGAGGLGCQGGAAAGTATEPLSLRTGSGGGAPLAWAVGVGASHPSHPGLQRWARLTPACCPHPWEWAHPDMVMGEGPPSLLLPPLPARAQPLPPPLGKAHAPPHTLHLPRAHDWAPPPPSYGSQPRPRAPQPGTTAGTTHCPHLPRRTGGPSTHTPPIRGTTACTH